MRRILVVVLILLCSASGLYAWGNRGHQLVAYIAYMNLDPQIRAKVDDLVQRNPCIDEWKAVVKTLPAAQQPVALFMLASNWPDRIKLAAPMSKTPYDCPGHPVFSSSDGGAGPTGHFSADIPPSGPEASQNIGYTDNRRHKYWHFDDAPISGDGTKTVPASQPNALTQLVLLSKALGTNETPSLRSYDMVWVEHLTGDIHQPLHDAQRFTKALPNGDAGGNLVAICPGTTPCRQELHAYWDDLPGSDSSLAATITMGAGLNQQTHPTAAAIDLAHPEDWAAAATKLAQNDAYAAPFNGSNTTVDPSKISDAYHAKAVQDMKSQIFIGGYRLAGILNSSLASYTIGK